MKRTTWSLWLALALGIVSAACSKSEPNPTEPAISADRQQEGGRDGDKDREHDDDDDDRPVTYAVIGDVPYGASAAASFPKLITAINQDPAVKLAVHLGDIKSGDTQCTDTWFQSIADAFTTFTDPLVYLIGDNEWTDCHRLNNGGFNPIDRLNKVRQLFFANPGYTLGGVQKKVKAQKDFPENQLWESADVVFAGFHVIGSNNGRAPWFGDRVVAPGAGETAAETTAREAEYLARNSANIAWLERSFKLAREEHAAGVVLLLQADLWHPVDRAAGALFDAHTAWVAKLAELAAKFKRPVLMIAGDSHDYRVDPGVPWFSLYGVTPPANVTQIIVDRSIEADIDYLRLTVNPRTAAVFSWEQVFVP